MSKSGEQGQCVALGDGIKAVLLDVAGTTTSLTFVKVSVSQGKMRFCDGLGGATAGRNPCIPTWTGGTVAAKYFAHLSLPTIVYCYLV